LILAPGFDDHSFVYSGRQVALARFGAAPEILDEAMAFPFPGRFRIDMILLS
jgi:hypothetical protein